MLPGPLSLLKRGRAIAVKYQQDLVGRKQIIIYHDTARKQARRS